MMTSHRLSIATYNTHGHGPDRIAYINKLLERNHIIFIQEHWLFDSSISRLENQLSQAHVHGVSGMDEHELILGRPYGGVAIIWRKTLKCAITPIPLASRRLCAAMISVNGLNIMLFNVYMPCDTQHDQGNLDMFNEVLEMISQTCTEYDGHQVIIGGDLNTDLSRSTSLHTQALNSFLEIEFMKYCLTHVTCDVDYTYLSKMNNERSVIDHFLLTDNLFNTILVYMSIHEGDNLSDHSALQLVLQLPIQYSVEQPNVGHTKRVQWHKANNDHIMQYKRCLDELLDNIVPPSELIRCDEYTCTSHDNVIDEAFNSIVDACLEAGRLTLPYSNDQSRATPIAGWSIYVAESREKAMLWHRIWQESGSPTQGVIHDIRKCTRTAYHYAIRHAKRQADICQSNRLADALLQKRTRDFWKEVKGIKGKPKQRAAMIDGVLSDAGISELFANKYRELYNSVSYTDGEMCKLFNDIKLAYYDDGPARRCDDHCICKHPISAKEVKAALSKIKSGKSDGKVGFTTDYLKFGTHKLHEYIAWLLSAMLRHGYVPNTMLLSYIIPIPKNRRKSQNDSTNYRGIALSNVIGKVLDWVIIHSCKEALKTSDYQFGFKPAHCTSQCTFVVNETIQYYVNGGSHVYTMLLDASQAFDRVNYIKLFTLLLNKGLCPLVCRLLAMQYTGQSASIKWGETFSPSFPISNGVKQGGVLSPILFAVYMDVLFEKLSNSQAGCHIGQKFMGGFGYADDVILIAPAKSSMYALLDICMDFSREYQVKFNPTKCKLIVYKKCSTSDEPSIMFDGQRICSKQHDVHLGHIIGPNVAEMTFTNAKNDFTKKVNVLMSYFKNTYTDTKYELFKVYCMPLYGSVLWDFSSRYINSFYTTWRKCIRRLFGLPARTHNALLPCICNDMPPEGQLHTRFLNFMMTNLASNNSCVKLCSTLSVSGSGSAAGKSLNHICSIYNINKYTLTKQTRTRCNTTVHDFYNDLTEENGVSAGAIHDLLIIRGSDYFRENAFTSGEIREMVEYLSIT